MRIGFLGQCLLMGILLFASTFGTTQTEIFRENFNEANGSTSGVDIFGTNWSASCPTCDGYYEVVGNRLEQNNSGRSMGGNILPQFLTSPINIATCNTLTISMNYTGGVYAGSGGFESEDECPDMAPTCAGDPDAYEDLGCFDCWDFFLVDLLYNDGSEEIVRFIGAAGDLPTNASINYNTSCLGDKSSVSLRVRTQTWGGSETNTMDNVIIVCNDPPNDVRIDQIPPGSPLFCVDDNVELEVNNAPGEDFEWFDPNGNTIGGNTNSISFSASPIFGTGMGSPQTFSVITTDGSGCKSTDDWSIIVNQPPAISIPGDITACEGDFLRLEEVLGNGTSYLWNGPYPGSSNAQAWDMPNLLPSHSGTYSITVSDGSGCDATASLEVTVEPSGSLVLPNFTDFCNNESARFLNTSLGGVDGEWSGPGISSNTLDPSTLSPGSYNITFTPNTGCTMAEDATISIIQSPIAMTPTSPLTSCGAMTATFDLTQLNDEVNDGSGLSVEWFSNANMMDPISDPTAYNSGNATVYAVTSENGCFSDEVLLDLMVTAGPEIMMAPSITGCGTVTLNNISIINQSGNQAYYDASGGAGNQIPVGTTFTLDTVVFAYDESGSCSDEQRIEVNVGQNTDAGPDLIVDTCFSGILDLQTLIPLGTDAGSFFDMAGNAISNDSLFVSLLGITSIELEYRTAGDPPCPPDEANYTINFLADNDAGRDSAYVICTGESIDIRTLTEDNGLAGFFEFTDGTSNPQTMISMQVSDQPFQLDFYYIVNSSGSCEPDTALISLEGLESKTEIFNDDVCADFSIDVFGTIYNSSNPVGSEMGVSQSGCDSLVNIDLNFLSENRVLVNTVLCTDQEIIVNNEVYNEANPVGTEILMGADVNGCDSIVEIDLTFDTEIRTMLQVFVCDEMDTIVNGMTYNSLNPNGETPLMSSTGCDSIVEVEALFSLSSSFLITGTYCPGDTVTVEGEIFNISRPMGMITLEMTNQYGCDSSLVVDLDFDMSYTREIRQDLCSDKVITVNNVNYGAENPIGMESISNPGNCDSLLLIDLNILLTDTIYLTQTFCNDTSILVNGTIYNAMMPSGEELIASNAENGCNQYVFIDLMYEENRIFEIDTLLCMSDSVLVNGVTYNFTNPVGEESIMLDSGCDSIISVNLSFEQFSLEANVSRPSCEGGSDGVIKVSYTGPDPDFIRLGGGNIIDWIYFEDSVTGLIPGVYFLDWRLGNGCTDNMLVTLEEPLTEDLSIDANLIADSYYQIATSFSGEVAEIEWIPEEGLSCKSCLNPEARPAINTTYVLQVIDESGCTYTDSLSLRFLVNSLIYQPNVFSPNDDGVNDVFYLNSDLPYEFRNFRIYDRWGNVMFKRLNGVTGDENDGWSGESVEQGVFTYILEVDFLGGTETIYGEVSLIR